jgi:hypothetical protein
MRLPGPDDAGLLQAERAVNVPHSRATIAA